MSTWVEIALLPTTLGIATANRDGGGTNYIVQANNGSLYWFFVDNASDLAYVKSTDRGLSWSQPVVAHAGTVQGMAVWYGRWSGLSDDKIHVAYTDAGTHDILYISLDTASDTLGTPTTVFDGVSASVAGSGLSITRDRAGNLRVAGAIDNGVEDGAWSSTDAGATWGDTIADPSEAGSQDEYALFPGFNADASDTMLIFWDASTNELSVKRYDDSANTWTETIIATGMTDTVPSTNYPNFAAFVDLTNSQIVLIAWSATDTATARLRCWTINDTTITAKTDVVSSSGDDQGFAGLGLDTDTGYWHAFYLGKTDGSETFQTALSLCRKISTDSGATWGSEEVLSAIPRSVTRLYSNPRRTIPGVILCGPVGGATYGTCFARPTPGGLNPFGGQLQ